MVNVNYQISEKGPETNKAWKDAKFLGECADYLNRHGLSNKWMLGSYQKDREGILFLETNYYGQIVGTLLFLSSWFDVQT